MNKDLKILNKLLLKRFEHSTAIKSIAKNLSDKISTNVFDRYKDNIILQNNMTFKLLGVSCSDDFYYYTDIYTVKKIGIRLSYVCTSKLPKDKRENLERAIESYKKDKYFGCNPYKVPIYFSLGFNINSDKLINNTYNLDLENIE